MTLLQELNEGRPGSSELYGDELFDKLTAEIEEDASRFDFDDEQSIQSWVENVFDSPSNTLAELLKQIPRSREGEYYDELDRVVDEIATAQQDNLEGY